MTTTERPPNVPVGSGDGPHAEQDPVRFGLDPGEPWPDDVPPDQDDTWWRFRDDPRAARRAELKIAFCWSLTLLAGLGLMVLYVVGGQPQAEGSMLFVGFGALAVGLILWARDLLPGHEVTASRGHHAVSSEQMRNAVAEALSRGTEPIARRPFLAKMLGLVGGVFGLAILFPIASLGPRVDGKLYKTAWGKGVRLVTEDNTPVRPGDVAVGGILTVFPENNVDDPQGATMLLNLGDAPFEVLPGRQTWIVNGLVAFSKICTHAGCPVGLFNATAHQLICPCHQSTFDVLQDCKPVFGPAPRSLPQLALAVNNDGYLIAQGPYDQPVGPGFWNRK